MNKKGDVPTVMLVVVALTLSVIALAVFASYDNSTTSKAVELSDIISQMEFKQVYIVAEASLLGQEAIKSGTVTGDLKVELVKMAGEREQLVGVGNAGDLFGKIRSNEFMFDNTGKGYSLVINDITLQSSKGYSKMNRAFNIYVEFNDKGEVTSTKLIGVPVQGVAQGL